MNRAIIDGDAHFRRLVVESATAFFHHHDKSHRFVFVIGHVDPLANQRRGIVQSQPTGHAECGHLSKTNAAYAARRTRCSMMSSAMPSMPASNPSETTCMHEASSGGGVLRKIVSTSISAERATCPKRARTRGWVA